MPGLKYNAGMVGGKMMHAGVEVRVGWRLSLRVLGWISSLRAIANGLLSAKVCGEAGLVEGVPVGVADELEEVSLEVS